MLVDQEAHQLGDRDRQVGVVGLDRDLIGQEAETVLLLDMPAQQILGEAEVKKYSWVRRSSWPAAVSSFG